MKWHKYKYFYFNRDPAEHLRSLFVADYCFIGPAPRCFYRHNGINIRKRDPDKIRPKNLPTLSY